MGRWDDLARMRKLLKDLDVTIAEAEEDGAYCEDEVKFREEIIEALEVVENRNLHNKK